MILIKTLRFSRGYVRFAATGASTERFYNLTVQNGLHLWDVTKQELVLEASASVKDYRKLRKYAKKTGTRLRVVQKHGAPFWTHKYRKRVGLAVGTLLFFAFLAVMSNFIWDVEVTGNEVIPTEEILQVVEALGVKVGAYKPALDVRSIERHTLLELQRLSWIAVNISGSTAVVEVRERVMPPEMMLDNDTPCNVVARRTGQIRYMEIFDGQSVVMIGDTVQEGELIVSGILENKYGTAILKHARATVLADVEYTIEVEIELNQTLKIPTGAVRTRHLLGIFGGRLPLFVERADEGSYDLQTQVEGMNLLGIGLPLDWITETRTYYTLEQVVLSEEEAKQNAWEKLYRQEELELAGARILDKQTQEALEGDVYRVTARYLCEMDIAKEQEILLNE